MALHPFHQTSIFESNTRLFCKEWNLKIGKDLAKAYLSLPEVQDCDILWAMGIWSFSPASIEIAKAHPGLQMNFKKYLSDYMENDVIGSPYAIFDYIPNTNLCDSWEDLLEFKKTLNEAGKKLILDFVPNHLSVDSIWIERKPNAFLEKEDKTNYSQNDPNFFQHGNGRIYAHGRDPYFSGWTDTVQFDFSNKESIDLAIEFLLKIAEYSDGVRCDMAMLPLEDVFYKTHTKQALPYWDSIISAINHKFPNFIWIAEVYWNREYELQKKGFHLTYDKILYDRLKAKQATPILGHLQAEREYQKHSLRFLENHDEERATLIFKDNIRNYWSLLNFLEGAVLVHEKQSQGLLEKVPVQLGRYKEEAPKQDIINFYRRVHSVLKLRKSTTKDIDSLFLNAFDSNSSLDSIEINIPYFADPNYFSYESNTIKLFIRVILTAPSQWEIFIWNPNDFIVSGRAMVTDTIPDNCKTLKSCMFHDIINDSYYSHNMKELLEYGFYFKLHPSQAHWLVLDYRNLNFQ